MSATLTVRVQPSFEDMMLLARRVQQSPAVRKQAVHDLTTHVLLCLLAVFVPPYLIEAPFVAQHYLIASGCVGWILWSGHRKLHPTMKDVKQWAAQVGVSTYLAPYTISVNEHGVEWTAEGFSGEAAWSQQDAIEEAADRLLIWTRHCRTPVMIPLRSFHEHAEFVRFVDSVRRWRAAVPSLRPRCPTCDYDLRGMTKDGCPECGWRREAS